MKTDKPHQEDPVNPAEIRPAPKWASTRNLGLLVISAVIVLIVGIRLNQGQEGNIGMDSTNSSGESKEGLPANISSSLQRDFSTNFSKTTLDDFSLVISGGPGKDGIPAISNPKFESLADTSIPDTTRGILIDLNGEQRFYSYNILVWHEIVNDRIGDTDVAVTFCPLCGSAVAYDRNYKGEVLEFGVSGFLRESNMIMFDRTDESLWQQSTGESFAGAAVGGELDRIPFQLIELFTVKEQFPNALIMTDDTGFSRDYGFYPYGNYDNEEDSLFFPVTVDDNRFPSKELFYIVERGEKSVAMRVGELSNGDVVTFSEAGIQPIRAEKTDGLVRIFDDSTDQELPGYYEMWFSWATWHQDDGIVWQP